MAIVLSSLAISVTAQYSMLGFPPKSGMTTIALVIVLLPSARLEPVV